MKIEESNGQISHHGSAMAAVFRGLIGDERAEETAKAEGTVEVIDQPPFHAYTEKDPCYPKLMLAYQTITAAPVYQNVSQEVCISRKSPPGLVNKIVPGTSPEVLSAKSQDNTGCPST